jgi:predicted phage tail protein
MWITIEAERILYVDRGRETILCDRVVLPTAGALVVRLSDEQVKQLAAQIQRR